jgi:hypothetical protein
MSNINGSNSQGRNVTEGESLGIGLTLDREGDPIVLLWVEHENDHYGVALTEDAALALAQSLIGMASEITQLRDTVDLTPEELDERMRKIVQDVAEGDPDSKS